MSLYLSRLTLSRRPEISTLGGLIDPNGPQRLDAHHKLIWSAFSGDPDAPRDFLWRADSHGKFLVLSPRPPQPSPLFEPPEVRDFAPDLRQGDRLNIALRANATKSRTIDGRKKRVDVVMDALPPRGPDRVAQRLEIAATVARDWLLAQGGRHGFDLTALAVEDYSVPRFRKGPKAYVTFGVLDLTGQITVREPEEFLTALAQGFGRAKAFGCGLMLIRRA